jgi:hypothetical protein
MSTVGDADLRDWDTNKDVMIQLTEFVDNPDGSADCNLRVNAEGMKYLLNFALVEMLKRAIEQGKVYTPPEDTKSKLWRKRK